MATARAGWRIDPFTIAIAITVGVASLLPCRGRGAEAFALITDLAIGLLFFLHGARRYWPGSSTGGSTCSC